MPKLSSGPVIGAPGKERHEHFNEGARATWAPESDRFWWSFHPIVIWLGLCWEHPQDPDGRRKTPGRY